MAIAEAQALWHLHLALGRLRRRRRWWRGLLLLKGRLLGRQRNSWQSSVLFGPDLICRGHQALHVLPPEGVLQLLEAPHACMVYFKPELQPSTGCIALPVISQVQGGSGAREGMVTAQE